MNYEQSVHYLLTLGRELASPQHARAAKFDLENIRVLCRRLGDPQKSFRSVHVAGTNGKGSTCAMLLSILSAARLRAGLYTSPHLLRINERIRIGGAEISYDEFAVTFTRVHEAIEELLASSELAGHPTFFECVTAMAFDYFARQKIDIAVIEVGMGGRLDSTNIVSPEVAVITQIDFDHENFLGHSIEEIAAEKAGIIKLGVPVVSAAAHPGARGVIRRRAIEMEAPLIEVEDALAISNVQSENGRYCFTAAFVDRDFRPSISERQDPEAFKLNREIEIALSLPGRFQVKNALTSIAAARELAERGLPIADADIVKGLGSVHWPGRLQQINERPAIYLDGTHNPAGARELLHFWNENLKGRPVHLIYGAMRDKAVDEVAGLLFPRAASVILTQSVQPRSISAGTLASLTGYLASSFEVIPEPAAALERAIELAALNDIIFVTGSLYLVGDLLRYWNQRSSDTPLVVPSAATDLSQ